MNLLNRVGSLWCACVLLTLLVTAGCGDGRPQRVPVSGTVLIDGQPVTCGFVRFFPDGNRASAGEIDKNGHFQLSCFVENDGAVLGKHRIAVTASEPVGGTQIRWHAPKIYADPYASGLEQEITGPNDSVVINLTWAGGKPFIDGGIGGKAEDDGDPPRLRARAQQK